MSRIIFFLFINSGMLFIGLTEGWGQSTSTPCNTSDYQLVFYDEFNGTGINPEYWRVGPPNDNRLPDGISWNDPANYLVSNGTLKLYAKNNAGNYPPVPYSTATQSYSYTGSMLFSKYSFGPGRYEIRCKIPPIDRAFPSFWGWHYAEGTGACWNELDIFEFWRDPWQNLFDESVSDASKKVKMTIHKEITCGSSHTQEGTTYTGVDYSQGFHTFAADWSNERVVFYVDGTIRYTIPHYFNQSGLPASCSDIANSSVVLIENVEFLRVSKSMNLLLQLAVKNNNRNSQTWPITMEIDYVKVWQHGSCQPTKTICGLEDWGTSPSFVSAGTLVAGGTNCSAVLLPNTFPKVYTATTSIQFLPGFHAQAGSTMAAKIAPCPMVSLRMENPEQEDPVPARTLVIPNALEILPNPNSGNFRINCYQAHDGKFDLFISDLAGRAVFQKSISLNAGNQQVELEVDLPPGIYLVTVPEMHKTVKMIIQ